MKVKDIVEKIDDSYFEVKFEDDLLYTNEADCRESSRRYYDSCKDREVYYISLENYTKYTNNDITVCSRIIIYVLE